MNATISNNDKRSMTSDKPVIYRRISVQTGSDVIHSIFKQRVIFLKIRRKCTKLAISCDKLPFYEALTFTNLRWVIFSNFLPPSIVVFRSDKRAMYHV